MASMVRALCLVLVVSLALVVSGCRSRGRAAGTVSCAPGSAIRVACHEGCGVGACTGDPVLRVCDGTSSVSTCIDGVGFLGEDDDSGACGTGLCSSLDVTCPSSGSITVVHRAYSGGSYACAWEVQALAGSTGLTTIGDDDAGR